MEEILNTYGMEIAGVVGVALGWLLKKLTNYIEKYVAGTATKFDDELLAKIKETVKEAMDESK